MRLENLVVGKRLVAVLVVLSFPLGNRIADGGDQLSVLRAAPNMMKRIQEIRDSLGLRIGAVCSDRINGNRTIGRTGFADDEQATTLGTNGVNSFLTGVASAAEPPPKMRLLVPAYFYPAGKGAKEWEKLLAAPEEAGIVAILNPASGPGRRMDPNYMKIIERVKTSKVSLIGYVSTSYGKRKTEDVKADVDAWLRFYPGIEGIFFDEQASGTEQLEQLAALYQDVRQTHKLSLVVTNPGTICNEKYLTQPVTDVACLYEGHEHWDRFTPPVWTNQLKPARIAALAYDVAAADMPKYLKQAKERRVGWIFITDDKGNNPWDQLPSYWEQEVQELTKMNRSP